jgi:hypothetical protein
MLMGKDRKPVKPFLGIFESRTPHRMFEDYCENYLKRRYPGYDITPQHHSHTSSSIADYFGINKIDNKERFSAECKHVLQLTKSHVDQAANVYPRFPQEKLLLIPLNTEVPENVKEYSYRTNVEIVRLRTDFH